MTGLRITVTYTRPGTDREDIRYRGPSIEHALEEVAVVKALPHWGTGDTLRVFVWDANAGTGVTLLDEDTHKEAF